MIVSQQGRTHHSVTSERVVRPQRLPNAALIDSVQSKWDGPFRAMKRIRRQEPATVEVTVDVPQRVYGRLMLKPVPASSFQVAVVAPDQHGVSFLQVGVQFSLASRLDLVKLVEVLQERVATVVHQNLTDRHMRVHLALTSLPMFGPEPSLIGWKRHLYIAAHTRRHKRSFRNHASAHSQLARRSVVVPGSIS